MTTLQIVAPRKLIEVALPLDDINRACAKEKSIREGHPSTLHLWWARRPLAAARAVLFAQLVNDPAWKYSDADLKKPQVRSAITRKRNELFRLMSELVLWANSTNEEVLSRAHAEIRASWKETCDANSQHPQAATLFNPKVLPDFQDPFAGGGAIPLEAQRLGLNAFASDLNPVAVLINKAMIEIPPRFAGRAPVGPALQSDRQTKAKATVKWDNAKGLAEDVRRYGHWMREEAERRIGHLYPKIEITKEMVNERPDLKAYLGKEFTAVAWLWVRTVKSPNPAFADVDVPLSSSFMLSTKKGSEAWVETVVSKRNYSLVVRCGAPEDPAATKTGTKLARGANFRCIMSGAPIPPEHIYSEANEGRLGERLMAIAAEGEDARIYLSPTSAIEKAALAAQSSWKPTVEMPANPRWFSPPLYGLKTYGDLFTARQLVAMTTFADLVRDARENAQRDARAAGFPEDGKSLEAGGIGAVAYGDAIALLLSFTVSRLADRCSSVCSWDLRDGQGRKPGIRNVFSRQAIPMAWDFAEANPFSEIAASLSSAIWRVADVVENLPARGVGVAQQADAATENGSRDRIISTDPPYYDNIGYADLSDFFYVWLRRSLKDVLPQLLATLAVPKAEELIASPYRHGGKEAAERHFLDGMTLALRNMDVESHCTYPVTIYYAFKQSDTGEGGTSSTGWETFLEACLRAGFAITGTWPMRTELGNRLVGNATNALASSIVLVFRRRTAASTVARKEFLRELQHSLPVAISEMTADPIASIAPVDLAQAAIGPGMAIFSKHENVLEADGSAMSVHTALVHINKAIDDFFAQAEGDLDADTRFCIGWFQQYGFEAAPFGDADVLARAKGTSVEGVKDAGVISASKGKVRLLKIDEMPKDWDPATDDRVPVWEACHHMCRALDESEGQAGALLAKMPEKQEPIRMLAYWLYTLCERKGWAEQARPYNELIVSWPSIVQASESAGIVGTQMKLI